MRPDLPDVEALITPIREMFEAGMLTKGRWLAEFESRLAEHLQVKHAVCVSSCTSGLMLASRGLGLQGEAIVPSFTFMATVSALVWAGVTPVFADVDPATTNVDPAAVEAAVTPRTSAIIAVHNFGNPADLDALVTIAERHGLKLVFDAAHGFGTRYQGMPVGGRGDAQVFSLSPTKLVVAGEGGVVATNSNELAEYVRIGREYGNNGAYDSAFAGLNARMPEISALIGLHSLELLEDTVRRRNKQAKRYRQLLSDLPGVEFMQVREGDRCSYKDFSIVIDAERFGCDRDVVAAHLTEERIDTRAYYDPPVHRHLAYRHFAPESSIRKVALPHTDRLSASSLSLPMGPHVSKQAQARIAAVIHSVRQS